MCGIIGYIGPRNPTQVLLDGLKRLEYRGYDSAGMALLVDGRVRIRRSVGKLRNLEQMMHDDPLEGTQGIGHTRWATHGKPSIVNAHPHKVGPISLVHNGIIENHTALAKELLAGGAQIQSETDTEIVAHLIAREVESGADLIAAVRRAIVRLEGAYAFVVQSTAEPGKLIGARKGSPLVVGYGEGESFVASDIQALVAYTKRVDFLNDEELALIEADRVSIFDGAGNLLQRQAKTVSWNPIDIEKSGHKHFMHKEIYEQPRAIIDSLEDSFDPGQGSFYFIEQAFDMAAFARFKRLAMVACGTAYHACLVGKTFIEQLAGLPCEVDVASEFRYREPVVGPDTLLVVVSQSGETADTLAAMREAQRRGAATLAIVNMPNSTIAREADGVVFTHAGPEIGVASTKAFTAQLVVLYVLAVQFARAYGRLNVDDAEERLRALARVPGQMEEILAQEEKIRRIAREFQHMKGFLFLGRGPCYPIALEGALKLKEISYLHAEGYAAGEMKHGPIALIDEKMLVLGLIPRGPLRQKMMSNLQEVRAREGKVVAVIEGAEEPPAGIADAIIRVPETDPLIVPLLMVLPLQLLAYHVADLLGTDVDQPRNLAKSVTVE
ncbi:MAG: glutamine--fructose-6-phosphate transaminase (isomerizing) [Myxococcales bacterium]|nr:glutamine--fructose-6-phosphate transaminase (isomerizing) [Myxococcales bacterium]